MSSFQYFQNQAEQKSKKTKFAADTFSLSELLQYTETAQKRSFEALCQLHPLVKTYRDKIQETSQAMLQAESSLGGEAEIPADYATAFGQVKESFASHLEALEECMSVLAQKRETDSEKAMGRVKQSGAQLKASLEGLSVPE